VSCMSISAFEDSLLGGASVRRAASSRAPTTCASRSAGTTSTPRPRRGRSTWAAAPRRSRSP
jgi:hypothetical protein